VSEKGRAVRAVTRKKSSWQKSERYFREKVPGEFERQNYAKGEKKK